MNFFPAAWVKPRAIAMTRKWNEENDDQFTPVEWIEEMVGAWRDFKEFNEYDTERALSSLSRFVEFRVKVPSALIEQIFPEAA